MIFEIYVFHIEENALLHLIFVIYFCNVFVANVTLPALNIYLISKSFFLSF